MTQSAQAPETAVTANGTTNTDFAPTQLADRLSKWRVDKPNTDESPPPAPLSRKAQNEPSSETAAVPDNGAETPSKPKSKPKSIKELAETLGVDAKDLYDISVPSSKEGESFTLGQLKDEMTKRDEFKAREIEWEETRVRKEAEFREAQNQLRTLLNALPKSALKPEVVELARQKAEQTATVERQRTLDAIPEWKNPDTLKQELTEIAEHLKSYDLGHLAQQVDSRLLKYLRDNYLRVKRLENALELVKQYQPASVAKSRPNAAKPKTEAPKASMSREARKLQTALSKWNSGNNN